MVRVVIFTLAFLSIELLSWEHLRDGNPVVDFIYSNNRVFKVGDLAFYKDHAVAKHDGTVINKHELLYWPAKVEKIEGSRIWLGPAYLYKSEVMSLDEAFDSTCEDIKKFPNEWLAWRRRGLCWKCKGEPGKALKDFDQAILLNPQGAEVFSDRGQLKSELSDFDGAIKDLDEAIRLSPSRSYLYLNRGEVKFQAELYTGAIQDLNTAIRMCPESPVSFYFRGLAKHRLHYLTAAMKDYDEAIRLNPNHHGAYRNRGSIKRDRDDLEGAIKDYDQELRLTPNNASILIDRGWIQHWRGNYDEAIKDYTRAATLETNSRIVKGNLAFLFATCPDASVRDSIKAIKLSEEALSLSPGYPYALSAKACAFAVIGKFDEAIELEEMALKNRGFANNSAFDGGLKSWQRILAWKQGKPWYTTPHP